MAENVDGNQLELSPKQREELLRTLKVRFEKHMNRDEDLAWAAVQAKLEGNPDKLWSLHTSSYITMVQNPIMLPGASVAR